MEHSKENDNKASRPRRAVARFADGEPTFSHCQWLYGEARDREFCRNRAEPGKVWCRHHMEVVYIRVSGWNGAKEGLEKKLEAQETDA